jgi:hypothetical protein
MAKGSPRGSRLRHERNLARQYKSAEKHEQRLERKRNKRQAKPDRGSDATLGSVEVVR